MEELLGRARVGDEPARDELLERHRARLQRMVRGALDPRLAARVDASDIVQETLAEAAEKLDDYTRGRPLPFYPWLRRLALRRMTWWRRFHLRASKRSVAREQNPLPFLDPRAVPVDLLADTGTSPSGCAIRAESLDQVHAALRCLSAPDREVLELRYLEGASFAEIADRMGIGLSAAKMRHLRAMERFTGLLEEHGSVGTDG
jgi:RNA polymerase sigma-70 factor (ECF subfamily)